MGGTKDVLKHDFQKTVVELADAHCHLDLMTATQIGDAINASVKTLITNGVDIKSDMESVKLADGKNVFVMLGLDPEHAVKLKEDELELAVGLIRGSIGPGVVGIGEIGLDGREGNMPLQKKVFGRMLDLALELDLPVSIHSRGALDEVLQMLEDKAVKKAHIHFFEGSVEQAKRAERLGCMISVPPLESGRRRKVIKEVSIDNIMAESDAPVAVKSPRDVTIAVGMIAEEKRITFEQAAQAIVANTKRYFGIEAGKPKLTLMRN
ncbi:MAG: TatD family hydrolase [Candidatus Micrarchaeota archaeon]|nr:TatD family hydrolase [Candidatus Micrarchaeota archaeon]